MCAKRLGMHASRAEKWALSTVTWPTSARHTRNPGCRGWGEKREPLDVQEAEKKAAMDRGTKWVLTALQLFFTI